MSALLFILQMMKFAWDNYKRYAWGKNELRPLTRNGHIGNMFGECAFCSRLKRPERSSSIYFQDLLTFFSGQVLCTKTALRQTKTEQGDIFIFSWTFTNNSKEEAKT